MGRHSQVEDPGPEHPEHTTSLTSTGSHRAIGKAAGRRRIAAWPVACLVLLGLLVAGWFGWNWADGVVASRAAAQATDCGEGNAMIRVAVDPSAQRPVSAAAQRWNATDTVVHGHCIRVHIEAAPDEQVLDSLLGRTAPSAIGGRPTAWVPRSAEAIDELARTRPDLIGSGAEPVAGGERGYQLVTFTGDGIDAVQQRAAQSFRAYLQQADFALHSAQ